MKNIAPIYFYMISVVCFVAANLIRDQYLTFYYVLLIVGILSFFIGFKNRSKSNS